MILSKVLNTLQGGYEKGTILFDSSVAGTYQLLIEHTSKIEVHCVGGGSGAGGVAGSSGGGFIGSFEIKRGLYTVKVGKGGAASRQYTVSSEAGGESSLGDFVRCTGGLSTRVEPVSFGGGGSVLLDANTSFENILLKKNGNIGAVYGGGGASVYPEQNYGAGGDSGGGMNPQNGRAGYLKIITL